MADQKGLKLNQVVALEKGMKSRAEKELTAAHHGLKKTELLNGFEKRYVPKDEMGEKRPNESKIVQETVEAAVLKTWVILGQLFDITAQKDFANCSATADVVVNDKILVTNAPISYLLWLEKQLVNLHTFVRELPTLSPAERWTYDEQNALYRTQEEFANSTKKDVRVVELSKATDKHPAQVQMVQEDVIVGQWFTTKFSGCIPDTRRREILDRVEKLQMSVKLAREQANMNDAPRRSFGDGIMNFLFSK